MSKSLLIISGMAPGPTGVGELIQNLLKENKQIRNIPPSTCRIIWGSYGYPVKRFLKERRILLATQAMTRCLWSTILFRSGFINKKIDPNSNILIIHPQTLGFKWTLELIKNVENPIWIFLADSSFFCVRSYNFLDGETKACTKCIGGEFKHSKLNNCVPYPVATADAFMFVNELLHLAKSQRVKFIAQNDNQSTLAKKHFGSQITVKVAGLWASGWLSSVHEPKQSIIPTKQDIVFHGRPIGAKGAHWALKLASHLPRYRFIFPFSKKSISCDSPPNCYFKEMSWETGLKEFVTNSQLVIVPSLWSAPIEGALIKSISFGKITAVVQNNTSFSDEISEDVILKLNTNHAIAASQIHDKLLDNPVIQRNKNKEFIKIFEKKNKGLLNRLLDLTTQ